MEQRTLGKSGPAISAVGLGCNNFGILLDADRSAAVVEAALGAGVTYFDTADIYSGGRSEEILGDALGPRQADVLVATKLGNARDETGKKHLQTANYVRKAAEASLSRLGADRIGLLMLHCVDPRVPREETLAALNGLVAEGMVRHLGCSNATPAQLAELQLICQRNGWAPLVCEQDEYSLLQRQPGAERLAAATDLGIGFLPYFPLASGLLSGKYRREEAPDPLTRLARAPDLIAKFLTDGNWVIVERLRTWAESRGRSLTDVAFAWLLGQPGVTCVVAGATSPAQISSNAAAAEWRLTPDEFGEVEHVFS